MNLEEKIKEVDQQIKDYYNNPSYSQSQLKNLLYIKNPMDFLKEDEDKGESYFKIGSAVDAIITIGLEYFNSKFKVLDLNTNCTPKVKSIIDEILLRYDEDLLELEDSKERLLDIANELEYQKNWKDETRLKTIIEQGYEYYNIMIESKGFTILTTEEFLIVNSCVDRLINGDYTSNYFKEDNLYQVSIESFIGSNNDIPFKCLLDMIKIDTVNKTYQVVDLKTTAKSVLDFEESFLRYRYDIQLAIYNIMVDKLKLEEQGYKKIAPCLLVVSTTYLDEPAVVFELESKTLQDAIYGKTEGGKEVIGFNELVKMLEFYLANGFTEHYNIKKEGGVFYL